MQKTLGLIHTSATLVPIFAELCSTHLPHVKTFNIVDDSLIKNTIACGQLTPNTAKRVVNHISAAQDAGADYILVTCSSIGAAVETAAQLHHIPVLRVDQPMADAAIHAGQNIGVIATLHTTLQPTTDLVNRRSAILQKEIKVTAQVCDGAFEALMNGNTQLHDEKVATVLTQLAKTVDVILLAQASMARVLQYMGNNLPAIPILTSPEIAIKYLATQLK
jgi:Asp/Glu/hydantoin racemase